MGVLANRTTGRRSGFAAMPRFVTGIVVPVDGGFSAYAGVEKL
jgi:hypothetical protein